MKKLLIIIFLCLALTENKKETVVKYNHKVTNFELLASDYRLWQLKRTETRTFKHDKQFFDYYKPLATYLCDSILNVDKILKKAFIESGGTSQLFSKYNNSFGFKANKYENRVLMKTKERNKKGELYDTVAHFKIYDCVYDSFYDYTKLMKIYEKNRK